MKNEYPIVLELEEISYLAETLRLKSKEYMLSHTDRSILAKLELFLKELRASFNEPKEECLECRESLRKYKILPTFCGHCGADRSGN